MSVILDEKNPVKPTVKQLTLVMIVDETDKRILLGMTKRGFGQGWWNGFGGKLKPGETLEECAQRETEEECGRRVTDCKKM